MQVQKERRCSSRAERSEEEEEEEEKKACPLFRITEEELEEENNSFLHSFKHTDGPGSRRQVISPASLQVDPPRDTGAWWDTQFSRVCVTFKGPVQPNLAEWNISVEVDENLKQTKRKKTAEKQRIKTIYRHYK